MSLSNEELRRRLAVQEWTAHNIQLNSDTSTMPGKPDFMETDLRLKAILRALSFFYREQLSGLRVADLGCLEGGFTLAMAREGMEVIGLEARQMNLDKCLLLKEHFDLPQMEFRLDDVKNFSREKYRTFDVVLALGIFYHLNDPVAWLQQVAAATRGMLIIESHYAPADDQALKLLDSRLKLGSLVRETIDGFEYEGRWFFEFEPHADPEVMPWASYSNNRSFWLTKESLLRAALRAGFDLVFEQHDYSADQYQFHMFTRSRGLFLAIKQNAAAHNPLQG
ncbi:MAG: methyltransferase type 11 [Acidobacteria bacterium]|nr:MAG: methyltransferase type 11 [Acidobacteriota bacterium]